jgi:hypothetical protein
VLIKEWFAMAQILSASSRADVLHAADIGETARTFSIPWLGRKRVAFVPLFRSNAAPPD